MTQTITGGSTVSFSFEIVRHTAKEETPLINLRTSWSPATGVVSYPAIISTLGKVTFYGTDQVGNAVQVSGSIQIDFGDFGDKS